MQSIKFYLKLTLVLPLLLACAGAKIKNETVSLKSGAITKSDTFLVRTVGADNAQFSGENCEPDRVSQEKTIIKQRLAEKIVEALTKKGFKAKLHSGSSDTNAVTLQGDVTAFDHGNSASRTFIGFGAGSSNMSVNLKAFKGRESLAEFQVIATSGGRGGLTAIGSFLNAHIGDAAEKTAEYFHKKVN